MKVLIVVESYWGNTAALAQAAADALSTGGHQVALLAAAEAPAALGTDVDLLLVGAPTHSMGLPSPSTRRMAAERGASAPVPETGVREWLGLLEPNATAIQAFDTHVSGFSGSAARAIVKLLRRRRVTAEVGETFLVAGEPPVLRDGELDRARDWGARLAGTP